MTDLPKDTFGDRHLDADSPTIGQAHDTGVPFGDSLTPREESVMALIGQGLSTRLVAKRINVRPRTVDKHVERVLRKLGARSRIEAVAILRARDDIPQPTKPARGSGETGPDE